MISIRSRNLTEITSRFSHHLSYEDALNARRNTVSPAWKPLYRKPVFLEKGHMQYLWDNEGKKYLDFIGGIVTVSVGHCHPRLNEALKSQMDKLWHTTTNYVTSPIIEYSEKLLKKFPEHLNVCFMTNSGTEANELALLMARLHTGRFDMLAMRNAYHGMGHGILGATNLSTWKHSLPVGFGFHSVLNADPYRGPWGGKNCRDSVSQVSRECCCKAGECEASDKYVNQVDDVLLHSAPKQGVAGIIIESIQGAGGAVQLPRGFVRRAFESVKRAGGVCISDEVQTGFGRMGDTFWGFQQHDATPDIVTMAKGIGNGFPLAALVTTSEIAESISNALHFNTFAGNPLAATVGSTVLDVIEEDGLMQNSRVVGDYLIRQLMNLKTKHECIGDVRGKGLFTGVEFVNPSASKKTEPMATDKILDILESLKDNGILVARGGVYGNVFRIIPPMCINKENCDEFVHVFSKVIKEIGY